MEFYYAYGILIILFLFLIPKFYGSIPEPSYGSIPESSEWRGISSR